jgi:hypothetical protein
MRFFILGFALAVAILWFADRSLAVKFQQSGPAPAQNQSEPSEFNDRIAAVLVGQIKESLQGHSQKKMLAAFDLAKMKDGARFKQQVNSFFEQTGTIRVHLNLQQALVEGSEGVAVLDAEMEAEPLDGNALSLHKHLQLRLIAEPGASGWKITDVRPRSFFSTQP